MDAQGYVIPTSNATQSHNTAVDAEDTPTSEPAVRNAVYADPEAVNTSVSRPVVQELDAHGYIIPTSSVVQSHNNTVYAYPDVVLPSTSKPYDTVAFMANEQHPPSESHIHNQSDNGRDVYTNLVTLDEHDYVM